MAARVEIDWDAQPLGQMADSKLAERLRVSPRLVGRQRAKRGIPVYRYAREEGWKARKARSRAGESADPDLVADIEEQGARTYLDERDLSDLLGL